MAMKPPHVCEVVEAGVGAGAGQGAGLHSTDVFVTERGISICGRLLLQYIITDAFFGGSISTGHGREADRSRTTTPEGSG